MLNFIRQTSIAFFCSVMMGGALWAVSTVLIDQDPNHRAVTKWLSDNLNDAKSLEIVEWGQIESLTDAKVGGATFNHEGFAVPLRYRAANVMGGVALHESVFIVVGGKVITKVDSKHFESGGHLID